MTSPIKTTKVCEVVGVLKNEANLENTIDHLLTSGFDQSEISLLATERSVVEKLGHRYNKLSSLEGNSAVPRIAYVASENLSVAKGALIGGFLYVGTFAVASVVLAMGWPLPFIVAGGFLGAVGGGLIGLALGQFVEANHADYLQEQLEHGGLLLWVRARDRERETKAMKIMKSHHARDIRSVWCALPA